MNIDRTTGADSGRLAFGASADDIADQFGGDTNAEIAAMMLVHAKESRDLNDTARAAEEKHLEAEEDAQVAKMHDQADAIRAAGIAEGFGDIAQGLATMGAGAITISGATISCGDLEPGARGQGTLLTGIGQGAAAGGKLVGAGENGRAKDLEAEGADDANHADQAKRRLDDLREQSQDDRELTKTAVDFLRQAQQAKAEADRASVSIRA